MKHGKEIPIMVDDRLYLAKGLLPLEAFDWGEEITEAFGPGLEMFLDGPYQTQIWEGMPVQGLPVELWNEKVLLLAYKAVQRCVTSDGVDLSDEANLPGWIRRYRQDFVRLGLLALEALVRDYFVELKAYKWDLHELITTMITNEPGIVELFEREEASQKMQAEAQDDPEEPGQELKLSAHIAKRIVEGGMSQYSPLLEGEVPLKHIFEMLRYIDLKLLLHIRSLWRAYQSAIEREENIAWH